MPKRAKMFTRQLGGSLASCRSTTTIKIGPNDGDTAQQLLHAVLKKLIGRDAFDRASINVKLSNNLTASLGGASSSATAIDQPRASRQPSGSAASAPRAAATATAADPAADALVRYTSLLLDLYVRDSVRPVDDRIEAWWKDRNDCLRSEMVNSIRQATRLIAAVGAGADGSSGSEGATMPAAFVHLLKQCTSHANHLPVIIVEHPEGFGSDVLHDLVSRLAQLQVASKAGLRFKLVFGVSTTREEFLQHIPATTKQLLRLTSVPLASSADVIKALLQKLFVEGAMPMELNAATLEHLRTHTAEYSNSVQTFVRDLADAVILHCKRISKERVVYGSEQLQDSMRSALAGGGTRDKRRIGARCVAKGTAAVSPSAVGASSGAGAGAAAASSASASKKRSREVSPPRLDPRDVPLFPSNPWIDGSGPEEKEKADHALISFLNPYLLEALQAEYAAREGRPRQVSDPFHPQPLPPGTTLAEAGLVHIRDSRLSHICMHVAAWLPDDMVDYCFEEVPSFKRAVADGSLQRKVDEMVSSAGSGEAASAASSAAASSASHATNRAGAAASSHSSAAAGGTARKQAIGHHVASIADAISSSAPSSAGRSVRFQVDGGGGDSSAGAAPTTSPSAAASSSAPSAPASSSTSKVDRALSSLVNSRLTDAVRTASDHDIDPVTGQKWRDLPFKRNADKSCTPIDRVPDIDKDKKRCMIGIALLELVRRKIGQQACSTLITALAMSKQFDASRPMGAKSKDLSDLVLEELPEAGSMLATQKYQLAKDHVMGATSIQQLRTIVTAAMHLLAQGTQATASSAAALTPVADASAGSSHPSSSSASAVAGTSTPSVSSPTPGKRGQTATKGVTGSGGSRGSGKRGGQSSKSRSRSSGGGVLESKGGDDDDDVDLDSDGDDEDNDDVEVTTDAVDDYAIAGLAQSGPGDTFNASSATISNSHKTHPSVYNSGHLLSGANLLYDLLPENLHRLLPSSSAAGPATPQSASASSAPSSAPSSASRKVITSGGQRGKAMARIAAAKVAVSASGLADEVMSAGASSASSTAVQLTPARMQDVLMCAQEAVWSWLQGIVLDYHGPIERVPLYEATLFTELSVLKRLHASPRTLLYRTLTTYWELTGHRAPPGCDGDGACSSALPDLTIMSRLYERSKGRLVHLGWWYQQFKEVATSKPYSAAAASASSSSAAAAATSVAASRNKRGAAVSAGLASASASSSSAGMKLEDIDEDGENNGDNNEAAAGAAEDVDEDDEEEQQRYGGGFGAGAGACSSPARRNRPAEEADDDAADGSGAAGLGSAAAGGMNDEEEEALYAMMEEGRDYDDDGGEDGGGGAASGSGSAKRKRGRPGVRGGRRGGHASSAKSQQQQGSLDLENMSDQEKTLLKRFRRCVSALMHHGVVKPYKRNAGVYVEKCLFNIEDWLSPVGQGS